MVRNARPRVAVNRMTDLHALYSAMLIAGCVRKWIVLSAVMLRSNLIDLGKVGRKLEVNIQRTLTS